MRIIAALAVTAAIASAALLTACSSTPQPTAITAPTLAHTPTASPAAVNPPTQQPLVVLVPTAETSTLPPSPTPPVIAATNPPAPTTTPDSTTPAPPPNAFLSTLSTQEMKCFPTTVETDLQFLLLMKAASSPFANQYVNCLSADNQFNLYLETVKTNESDPEYLSVDTHRCIWDGLAPIFKLKPEDNVAEDGANLDAYMAAAFLAPIAVMAYCLSDADLDRLSYAEPAVETAYMRCVVNHQGGAREFVQLLLGNPNTFQADLAAAELSCDQLIYGVQPSPSPSDDTTPTNVP